MTVHVVEFELAGETLYGSVDVADTVRVSWMACTDRVGAIAQAALIASGEDVEDVEGFHMAIERYCAPGCFDPHRFVPLDPPTVAYLTLTLTAGLASRQGPVQ